ncbi:MAG: alpha/beta hydrolase [Acidobacteriia bacterium]|nr:alpha/beta hydrolase [Terriglobia bacterium]
MARRIESHLLDGPAGILEALLEEPEDRPPDEAAVVCHPHPLFGGTMHNKVVYRVARALRRRGSVVLRFNFRGVNRSEGSHAEGVGEVEDARAALAWLRSRYPDLPYALAGFSFGARVVARLGCELAEAARLIAVGFPARDSDIQPLVSCTVPKVFISSTHDEFAPRREMETLYAQVAGPKQMIWIEAEDHFFRGALDQLEEIVLNLGLVVYR